jgi:hypothetical protein
MEQILPGQACGETQAAFIRAVLMKAFAIDSRQLSEFRRTVPRHETALTKTPAEDNCAQFPNVITTVLTTCANIYFASEDCSSPAENHGVSFGRRSPYRMRFIGREQSRALLRPLNSSNRRSSLFFPVNHSARHLPRWPWRQTFARSRLRSEQM